MKSKVRAKRFLTFFVDDGNATEHGGLGFGEGVARKAGVKVRPCHPYPHPRSG